MQDNKTVRLKEGFLLREVAGRIVVVPDGDVLDLNLMICLNGTGRFLWERVEKGATPCQLKQALMEAYDVDEVCAGTDVDQFLRKMENHGFLE